MSKQRLLFPDFEEEKRKEMAYVVGERLQPLYKYATRKLQKQIKEIQNAKKK